MCQWLALKCVTRLKTMQYDITDEEALYNGFQSLICTLCIYSIMLIIAITLKVYLEAVLFTVLCKLLRSPNECIHMDKPEKCIVMTTGFFITTLWLTPLALNHLTLFCVLIMLVAFTGIGRFIQKSYRRSKRQFIRVIGTTAGLMLMACFLKELTESASYVLSAALCILTSIK